MFWEACNPAYFGFLCLWHTSLLIRSMLPLVFAFFSRPRKLILFKRVVWSTSAKAIFHFLQFTCLWPIYNLEGTGLASFFSCKMADLCPVPCWQIDFAGFLQRRVSRDPFLATAFVLELLLWQPLMASLIIWFKHWVEGQAISISYISALVRLLLSCHLDCPSLECVLSCISHLALVVSSVQNCTFSG